MDIKTGIQEINKPSFMFIIYSLQRGGAERVVSILSNKLAQWGHPVCVVLYKRSKGEYTLNETVKVLSLKNYDENKGNGLTRSIFRMHQIRDIIKTEQPVYVIPFMSGALRDTLPATFGLPCMVIGTERSNPAASPKSRVARKVRDLCLALCDGVYLQNEGQKQRFSKKIQNKSFILPNPIDEEFLKLMPSQRQHIHNIVTIGGLRVEKNQSMLITAFGIVRQSYPNMRLYIYGEGVLREELQKQINRSGLSGAAFLMGGIDNVPQELDKADLFVLSSNVEGMPNALIEAMAAGLPCISTNCPTGPNELLVNGETGLLTPVNDAEKMAEAILWMVKNPHQVCELGERARTYAIANFSPERITGLLVQQLSALEK